MMHRRLFVTAGAAVGLIGVSTPGRAEVVWVAVSGPGNRYRLKMPLGYRYLQVPTHSGTLNSYVYMLPDKVTLELLDIVPASPHPVPSGAALATALEQAQGGMMKSWPGSTVREQRQIQTGPLTGREFVLAAAGDRFVRARFYLTPEAIYSQIAQGPMSQLGSPLVAQFFDSLRFG
ncbi:MAG: hypothetical protein EPO10_04150 [Reyranella sp.]|uniref:hypothetical protein n=1 Tax=Reyranella sp. TaxID=1929291 RepID=UPI001222D034|nr:hypothetical protein [Reyranella sp.]TAJ97478.1 MAG: hypothetical protein EPO41_03465 [Reyranella sp.]TBR30177.1 MAG: hypothetical protein EPO10_04150 [Reyranella sp.]